MSHPPFNESPEAAKARRLRNWALGAVLLAFVGLVFLVTIIRLGGHVFDQPPPRAGRSAPAATSGG